MCPLVMLAVGCSTSTSSQPGSPSSSAIQPDASGAMDAACPEAAPVPSDSVPATVHDFDKNQKWYGAEDLWVAKPTLLNPTDGREERHPTKYASMTLDARGRSTDQKGAPHVDAERLDRPGSVRGSTGGFATADGDRQWWPTVIDFPEAGCWRVTETLGSTQVRFTVYVGAR
ncbi:hypothetical protein [Streptomyces sp. NPDC052727]|uniref:hypothetical protein n=1 Tax=unclassified Streptomyces TaxID=2593676 RepID=UPI00342D809C